MAVRSQSVNLSQKMLHDVVDDDVGFGTTTYSCIFIHQALNENFKPLNSLESPYQLLMQPTYVISDDGAFEI